jgi:hypothetical protein
MICHIGDCPQEAHRCGCAVQSCKLGHVCSKECGHSMNCQGLEHCDVKMRMICRCGVVSEISCCKLDVLKLRVAERIDAFNVKVDCTQSRYSPCVLRQRCLSIRGLLGQASSSGGNGICGIDMLVFCNVPHGITRHEIAEFILGLIQVKFTFSIRPYVNEVVAGHMSFRDDIPVHKGCRDIVLLFEEALGKKVADRIVCGRESLILGFTVKIETPSKIGVGSSSKPAVFEEGSVVLPLNSFELLNLGEEEPAPEVQVEEDEVYEMMDDLPSISIREQIAIIKARKAIVDPKLERTIERIERYVVFLMSAQPLNPKQRTCVFLKGARTRSQWLTWDSAPIAQRNTA